MNERGDLEPISPGLERLNGGAPGGTRYRIPAIAVMSAAVVGLIVIGLATGSQDDKAALDGTAPGTASTSITTTAPLPTTVPWRRLPNAPVLQTNVTGPVWTGAELIVWSQDRVVFRFEPESEVPLEPLPSAPL